jgi:hypothetical protein
LRICKIIKAQDGYLRVQIKKDDFRSCHISDITDLITPYPLSEYKIGEYTICRIIDEKFVNLRKSIILKGFSKNMQEVLKNHGED